MDRSALQTEFAPAEISAYFLDLEGLLLRIDSATTYYQVLGVDRTDGQEKIKSSFQQLLNLLFPSYVVGRTMPADITPRIERAFQKASQAFAVLASFARRRDYDGALLSIASQPAPPTEQIVTPGNKTTSVVLSSTDRVDSSVAKQSDDVTLNRMPQRGLAYRETLNA